MCGELPEFSAPPCRLVAIRCAENSRSSPRRPAAVVQSHQSGARRTPGVLRAALLPSRRCGMRRTSGVRALSRQTVKSWSHERIPGMLQKRCFDPSPGFALFHGPRATPKHRKARAGRVQKRPEPPFASKQMIRMAHRKGGKYRRSKIAQNVNFFYENSFISSMCARKPRNNR